MNNNRVCQILGIEKPIIQAPMFWITTAELVASVSNAGCLGPNAGYKDVTTNPNETAERMRVQIRKVKTLTDKPFAVNLIVTDTYGVDVFTAPMVEVVIEERVPAVCFVGTANPELIKRLKSHGIKIIFRDLDPSVESAKNAESLGVDMIVATGFDEDGTLPSKVIGTFSIVPLLADSVDIPVLAAGGIADARTARAALALGAEGIYCGSAFIATPECQAAENVKQAMLTKTAEDLLFFRTVPAYYRSFAGELANELVAMDKAGKSEIEINQVMKGTSNLRVGMLDGDMDKGYVSVGLGVSFIREIRSACDVVNALYQGMV